MSAPAARAVVVVIGFALVGCPGASSPDAPGRSSAPVASPGTAAQRPPVASTSTPAEASGGPGPSAGAVPPQGPVVKSTSCPAGPMTYLGFRGPGRPSPTLVREIKSRFPDAIVVEVGDGMLGVVTAEPHDMNVRARHEAAAATVGWKGDVVDFPRVSSDCTMTFHAPVPVPAPH